MTNHLISVIVPVYNVEPYLRQCLDSIVNQTYPNIEILIVDDGSPDHCGEICDEYAEKDSRIIVIHQENAGLSAARNAALDIARGEYIMFVDSDDWVEPTYCEKALEMIQKHQVPMVVFGYKKIYKNMSKDAKTNHPRIMESAEAIRHISLNDEPSVCNAVWNKIYLKRLFQEIRFPLGMIYEDIAVMYKLFHMNTCIYVSNIILYNYRKRKYSLWGAINRKKIKNKCHLFQVRAERLAFLKENYPTPELIENQTIKVTKNAIDTMNLLHKDNPGERKFHILMSTFLKENKKYILTLPCDKKIKIYMHSKSLYIICMKLANLKGKLYSWLKTSVKKKGNNTIAEPTEYFN